jgi:serine protease
MFAVDQKPAVWGLDRIVPPLDRVYSYKYDGTGVKAFIFDSGILTSHSEFTNGRASCGYSAYDDDCFDNDGHGTHVAGTIGGAKYGVAKNVQLISVKVLDNEEGKVSMIFAGLNYVIGEKQANPTVPMVINMSLETEEVITSLNERIGQAVAAGIVTVVAAGNHNGNACDYSPSSARRAITVGATTSTDKLRFDSNIGRCVDILAPGQSIKSAFIESDTSTEIYSGTSMAAPHVAGVAVLHLLKDASLTPRQVLGRMKADALRDNIRMRPVDEFDERDKTPNLLLSAKSLLQ